MVCAGFGYGKVTFLPSGWCRAEFWGHAEHRVDNIKIFLLLLSKAYTEG